MEYLFLSMLSLFWLLFKIKVSKKLFLSHASLEGSVQVANLRGDTWESDCWMMEEEKRSSWDSLCESFGVTDNVLELWRNTVSDPGRVFLKENQVERSSELEVLNTCRRWRHGSQCHFFVSSQFIRKDDQYSINGVVRFFFTFVTLIYD